MRRLFYLVVALQLLFLIVQAGSNEIALRTAQVVYLRTAPVDPRSLFMGNYMALSYDISQIDFSRVKLMSPRSDFRPDSIVYAGLRPSRPCARMVAVSAGQPADSPPGLVWLRGRMVSDWRGISVEYGLERYYIPEGKEEAVARLPWNVRGGRTRIAVEVAVRGDGQGLIRRVLVSGRPVRF